MPADPLPHPGRRRRDRHARGVRGPLAPAGLPLARSRAERFDDLVLDAVERVEGRWSAELDGVEFAVEDVPALDDWERGWVPLGRSYPAEGDVAARIVVYRRPVEARAPTPPDLRDLIQDVVVEQVAELLGVEPEEVDPDYGDEPD